MCRSGFWRFLKKYKETGSVVCRPGSGRPTGITSQVLEIVEKQMQKDNETTAVQLQRLLVESGHSLSLKTILRSRRALGWTFRGSAYCQIIRQENCVKRFEWAKTNEALTDSFKDVLWTDKHTVRKP